MQMYEYMLSIFFGLTTANADHSHTVLVASLVNGLKKGRDFTLPMHFQG